MPILTSKKNIYSRDRERQKRKVDSSGFQATKERIYRVIDSQSDMDDSIFAGICECFEFIESGYIRTGIFVLGRTLEEIATLYIEKAISKRRGIGILKPQFEVYKKGFMLKKKLDFLSGIQVRLQVYGRPELPITFTKPPKINPANLATLHDIREFGRNVGAHPITNVELDNAIRNLDSWLSVGTIFIVDMQVEVNRLG